MNRCPQCAAELQASAAFCPQCGTHIDQTGVFPIAHSEQEIAHLAELTGEDRAAVDALPRGSALLIVQRGPQAGSRFLLDQDMTTAGRHPDSDVFLDDVTVSRRHARFERVGEHFTVVDVGSLNGTYVNRDRTDSAQLSNGDEVQIGKFRLVFFAGGL
jgi:pSer/pThr/pTyr-binding forkhead associated (FHA) protein